jgi:SAM-dependent methyltransferase
MLPFVPSRARRILDVPEHLVDPGAVLGEAKRVLRGDGCIVVSVPNVPYIGNLSRLLVKKGWQYASHGVLDRTHLSGTFGRSG